MASRIHDFIPGSLGQPSLSVVARCLALMTTAACTLSVESLPTRTPSGYASGPSGVVGTPSPDVATSSPDTNGFPKDCRPEGVPWAGGSAPLRLPCVRTQEECDGIDNDSDGFVDPHCPTIDCKSDSDCTYGGLLADADCNFWGSPLPACNQIDGFPRGDNTKCWGVLCPSGSKCVRGECMAPGSFSPNSFCSSGSDCPMNSGCIPLDHEEATVGVCTHFCHDAPCPDGYTCMTRQFVIEGEVYETRTCRSELGCPGALFGCAEATERCVLSGFCGASVCLYSCPSHGNLSCVLDCLTDPVLSTFASKELAVCILDLCGG
jgi:hypothetical protein